MSTKKLTEEQTLFIQKKIVYIAMAIQFERAKQLLLDGEALACIEQAKALTSLRKLRVFEIGIRYFPRLSQSSYRAHLRRVERRKRALRQRSLERAGFADYRIGHLTANGSVLSE